ncbi:Acriflavin resistance periplasmic protein [Granulibacter bethesdensis]|nr:Acriflavin resistance periplasmic protein [Granulibacter bethesdensis]
MEDVMQRTGEAQGISRPGSGGTGRREARTWRNLAVLILLLAGGGYAWKQGALTPLLARFSSDKASHPAAMPAPEVIVSTPLQRNVAGYAGFLGQFSARDKVELRAQVGGQLQEIHFTDGQIVHKGDLLFVIDPRPYEIKLAQANAQYQSAEARVTLAKVQLWRAQQLRHTDFGTAQTVDQRTADVNAALADLDQAKAAIRDAKLDLEFTHVVAPFTGRIGAHLVSVGSLVNGSRGGGASSTLMATLVSLDPVYLDFDMSESDYLAYARARQHGGNAAALAGPSSSLDQVEIMLGDEGAVSRHGRLDFIDNAMDRGSGTMHARATVPNADLFLVPGAFARLRLTVTPPAPVLLVPAAAVMQDQTRHIVMTVTADGTVRPKPVEIGPLEQGLRVIRSGLSPQDRVVIDGLMRAQPGMKVSAKPGEIRPVSSVPASTH